MARKLTPIDFVAATLNKMKVVNGPARSADMLASLLKAVPQLHDILRDNPELLDKVVAEITKQLPPPAYVADRVIYRWVVIFLGAVAFTAAVGGLIAIGDTTKEVPAILTALGSAAIGAVAGMLAPSPATRG